MTRFLLVCLGGAIGSGARYLTSLWAASALGIAFPWGTFIVNVTGSFLLAFLAQSGRFSPETRLLLTTGVMGGFTTYSTFNWETTSYLRAGAYTMAAANIVATLAGCLAAGAVGIFVAKAAMAR